MLTTMMRAPMSMAMAMVMMAAMRPGSCGPQECATTDE
jgi:hypothetical protein